MLCPVCKTECGEKTVCQECGFDEVGKSFVNRNEAELWFGEVVLRYRKLWSLERAKLSSEYQLEGNMLVKYMGKDTDSIEVPYGIEIIGAHAFTKCNSLRKVVLPDSATCIGELAFSYCEHLCEIIIPNGITLVQSGAFYRCASLKTIVFPPSVTSIGRHVFYGCSALKTITFAGKRSEPVHQARLWNSGCNAEIIVENEML